MLLKKIYHMGALVNERGGVSALCFKRPKAINLDKAMWTNRPDAVTCPKCRAALQAKAAGAAKGESA